MISVVSRGFLKDGAGGSSSSDTTPPTITVVSPTPGVAPGDPGGFPRLKRLAADTPIVLRVTDADPGLAYVSVVARFYVDEEDENPTEEVVYRRGRFRGLYVKGSFQTDIADGKELSVRRLGGWPSAVVGRSFIVFAVDPLDRAGNLAP